MIKVVGNKLILCNLVDANTGETIAVDLPEEYQTDIQKEAE